MPKPIKQGDMIICKNNRQYKNRLTIGKEYQVLLDEKRHKILIKDDERNGLSCHVGRFDKIVVEDSMTAADYKSYTYKSYTNELYGVDGYEDALALDAIEKLDRIIYGNKNLNFNVDTGGFLVTTKDNHDIIGSISFEMTNDGQSFFNEIFNREETKKMEKPKTELEKEACSRAKRTVIEEALEAKAVIYKHNMDKLIALNNMITNRELEVEDYKKQYAELADKLSVTKNDEKQLF